MPLSLTLRFMTDTVESRRAYAPMRQICGRTFIMLAVTLGYSAWRWSNFIVWDEASSASYNMFSNNGESTLSSIGLRQGRVLSAARVTISHRGQLGTADVPMCGQATNQNH